MENQSEQIDINKLVKDGLSDIDKQLILDSIAATKANIETNIKVLEEMRNTRISMTKIIQRVSSRIIEIAMLSGVSLAGFHLYQSLPDEQKQELASRALNEALPVLIAMGTGYSHWRNQKDNQETESELDAERADMDTFLEKYKDSSKL